jgi:UDP-glucose 4-epimerase
LRTSPDIKIKVLDNFSVGSKEDLLEVISTFERETNIKTSDVEIIGGDVRDYKTCLKCCEGVEVVIHLAASTGVVPSIENPRYDMETNVIGTLNMLEAARHNKVKKFIFASSGASIGKAEPPIHEDTPPRPVSPYGASKLSGEAYCSAYFNTYGVKTISLRFGNVYGPFSKHKDSVIAKFFKLALTGKPLEVYGDGKQTRDFIYIDDLLEAIMLSVRTNVGGETFQIATYRETTVNEIAMKIKEIVEKNLSTQVQVLYSKPRSGDVKRNYSDISKAKALLGFKPKFTLEEGLQKTFEYFLARTKGHNQ